MVIYYDDTALMPLPGAVKPKFSTAVFDATINSPSGQIRLAGAAKAASRERGVDLRVAEVYFRALRAGPVDLSGEVVTLLDNTKDQTPIGADIPAGSGRAIVAGD